LRSIIYDFLNAANYAFAEFLHNQGYKSYSGKIFKLFVFSDLKCKIKCIKNNRLFIISDYVEWYISSPIDDLIRYLVHGLFKKNNDIIIDNKKFIVENVEVLQVPSFKIQDNYAVSYFKMMSPMVLSTKKKIDGKLKQYYYRFDENFSTQLLNNLKEKYFTVTGKKNNCTDLFFEFDKDYIIYQLKNNRKLSKLRHINKWNQKTKRFDDIMVKGIFCPFKIKTDPELIRIGYECGFGEKNSTGFGMVDLINHR
jgi:CRISPR-associated endoribonuclease Cas6